MVTLQHLSESSPRLTRASYLAFEHGNQHHEVQVLSCNSDLIKINIDGNVATFERSSDDKKSKAMHGTTRANFHNMVVGVTEGYKKELERYDGYQR